jgi:hypothetical protein
MDGRTEPSGYVSLLVQHFLFIIFIPVTAANLVGGYVTQRRDRLNHDGLAALYDSAPGSAASQWVASSSNATVNF